ncbi:hypothetical protein Lal_00028475, partial [Lupinus albus]
MFIEYRFIVRGQNHSGTLSKIPALDISRTFKLNCVCSHFGKDGPNLQDLNKSLAEEEMKYFQESSHLAYCHEDIILLKMRMLRGQTKSMSSKYMHSRMILEFHLLRSLIQHPKTQSKMERKVHIFIKNFITDDFTGFKERSMTVREVGNVSLEGSNERKKSSERLQLCNTSCVSFGSLPIICSQ